MKNNLKRYLVLAGIFTVGLSHTLFAQSIYKVTDSKNNNMKLSGTSTGHDWVMKAHIFTGEANVDFKAGKDKEHTAIKTLTFLLPVLNLKSDNKKLDRNAYKALKSDLHKNIVYTLISATFFPEGKNKYLVKTIGILTIANVSKEIAMNVYCYLDKDSTIAFTGQYKLLMTNYGVKPPSFMMGAMKTGDAITLDFTMIYKKESGI